MDPTVLLLGVNLMSSAFNLWLTQNHRKNLKRFETFNTTNRETFQQILNEKNEVYESIYELYTIVNELDKILSSFVSVNFQFFGVRIDHKSIELALKLHVESMRHQMLEDETTNNVSHLFRNQKIQEHDEELSADQKNVFVDNENKECTNGVHNTSNVINNNSIHNQKKRNTMNLAHSNFFDDFLVAFGDRVNAVRNRNIRKTRFRFASVSGKSTPYTSGTPRVKELEMIYCRNQNINMFVFALSSLFMWLETQRRGRSVSVALHVRDFKEHLDDLSVFFHNCTNPLLHISLINQLRIGEIMYKFSQSWKENLDNKGKNNFSHRYKSNDRMNYDDRSDDDNNIKNNSKNTSNNNKNNNNKNNKNNNNKQQRQSNNNNNYEILNSVSNDSGDEDNNNDSEEECTHTIKRKLKKSKNVRRFDSYTDVRGTKVNSFIKKMENWRTVFSDKDLKLISPEVKRHSNNFYRDIHTHLKKKQLTKENDLMKKYEEMQNKGQHTKANPQMNMNSELNDLLNKNSNKYPLTEDNLNYFSQLYELKNNNNNNNDAHWNKSSLSFSLSNNMENLFFQNNDNNYELKENTDNDRRTPYSATITGTKNQNPYSKVTKHSEPQSDLEPQNQKNEQQQEQQEQQEQHGRIQYEQGGKNVCPVQEHQEHKLEDSCVNNEAFVSPFDNMNSKLDNKPFLCYKSNDDESILEKNNSNMDREQTRKFLEHRGETNLMCEEKSPQDVIQEETTIEQTPQMMTVDETPNYDFNYMTNINNNSDDIIVLPKSECNSSELISLCPEQELSSQQNQDTLPRSNGSILANHFLHEPVLTYRVPIENSDTCKFLHDEYSFNSHFQQITHNTLELIMRLQTVKDSFSSLNNVTELVVLCFYEAIIFHSDESLKSSEVHQNDFIKHKNKKHALNLANDFDDVTCSHVFWNTIKYSLLECLQYPPDFYKHFQKKQRISRVSSHVQKLIPILRLEASECMLSPFVIRTFIRKIATSSQFWDVLIYVDQCDFYDANKVYDMNFFVDSIFRQVLFETFVDNEIPGISIFREKVRNLLESTEKILKKDAINKERLAHSVLKSQLDPDS